MLTGDDVTRIVEDTVREQLAPCHVELRMKHDVDEDGDAVLRILVVIEADCVPDRRKMLGLARHIRTNLNEAVGVGFPVLSFVSKTDAAKLDFEAA